MHNIYQNLRMLYDSYKKFFFIESSLHFTSAASNDAEFFMKRRPL